MSRSRKYGQNGKTFHVPYSNEEARQAIIELSKQR